MTPTISFSTLALAALTLGAVHTLAPDHWLPFAALSRARRWSRGRTLRLIVAAGALHVAVTALLAGLGLWLGIETVAAWGESLAATAVVVLAGLGLLYAAWALHRRLGGKLEQAAEEGGLERLGTAGLLLVFALDPCMAAIPLTVAAAPLGVVPAVTLLTLYAAATVTTMAALAIPAAYGLGRLRLRFGDVAAGVSIAAVAVVVLLLGV